LDSDFCGSHRNLSPEVLKDRWLKRYVMHWNRFTVFNRKDEKRILSDLKSERIVLSDEDIQKIPVQQRFVDIYLLLMDHGYVKRGANARLEFTALWLYANLLTNYPNRLDIGALKELIERTLILSSGQALYDFILWLSYPALNRTQLTSSPRR
jgi:hypothetical protein